MNGKPNGSMVLQAFSHWTYEDSKNYLIIVDLQGVQKGNEFVLTDPAIHSEDQSYGETDFGNEGMKTFFKTHVCGAICKEMNLKEIIIQRN